MVRHFSQILLIAVISLSSAQGVSESNVIQKKDSTAVMNVDSSNRATDTIQKKSLLDTTAAGLKNDTLSTSKAADMNNAAQNTVVNDSVAQKISVNDSTQKIDSTVKVPVKIDSAVAQKSRADIEKPKPEPAKVTQAETFSKNGIGISLNCKLLLSNSMDNYLDDLYQKMKDDAPGRITEEKGYSEMPFLLGLRLKGIVFVGPVIGLEPYALFNYGLKMMRVTGYSYDVTAKFSETGAGLNMWARVALTKKTAFKTGLGGYLIYSNLIVDSYAGKVAVSGLGGGLNILAGVDITLKKVTLNIDFAIPVGSSELIQDGSFKNTTTVDVRYPKSYRHYGLEIRPGITINL